MANKFKLIASLAVLVMLFSGSSQAEPDLGRAGGGSAGVPCTEDWVSYTIEDGTVATASSATGLFAIVVVDMDESDVVVDGTAGGKACFEWGNDTTQFKLRHLCESAKWTGYWAFNAHMTVAPGSLGLALGTAEVDTVSSQLDSTQNIAIFAGVGTDNRHSVTLTTGGLTLNENTRIAFTHINLIAGTTNWTTKSGTKMIFITERCFT